MALASVIVQPANSKLEEVAEKMTGLAGVTVHSATQSQIIALLEAESLEQVKALASKIEEWEDVSGVYPVYVTRDDEEEE